MKKDFSGFWTKSVVNNTRPHQIKRICCFFNNSRDFTKGLNYTKYYRILNRMKVTALIPDEMVSEVKKLTKGKNITESLLIALNDWIAQQKIRSLTNQVAKNPLSFKKDFSALKIRSINRQSR